MHTEQDWTEAYKELCAVIKAAVTEIKHIDLWNDQTNNREEEFIIPHHSLFIDINADEITTLGKNVQEMKCMVTFYHVFNTLSDTFDGSTNQAIAFEFMPVNQKLHKCLQGLSGTNFSPLDRKTNKRVHHPDGYLMIREQAYECLITDYSAWKDYAEHTVTAIGLNRVANPPGTVDDLYKPDL